MSEPVILPPTCTIHCIDGNEAGVACDTAQMWEALTEEFTMPASGASTSIPVCDSSQYATGGYVWIEGIGYLEVTGKPNSLYITVRKNDETGNADAAETAAVGDIMIHCPPPEKSRWLEGSATWDPGSIADGDEEAQEVTVTGAALGDFALASFSLDVADLVLDAQVTAADTVTCVLANNTGGAVDLAEGTVRVRVFPM